MFHLVLLQFTPFYSLFTLFYSTFALFYFVFLQLYSTFTLLCSTFTQFYSTFPREFDQISSLLMQFYSGHDSTALAQDPNSQP